MKKLFLCGCVAAVLSICITNEGVVAQIVMEPNSAAVAAAPTITRANFLSLELQTSGGSAGLQSQLTATNGLLRLHPGPPHTKIADRTAPLTKKEVKALMQVLRDAQLPSLVGEYRQDNLADGINEVLILTLRKNGATRTYTVSNYGDRAPRGYYDVTAFLRDLQNRKLATN